MIGQVHSQQGIARGKLLIVFFVAGAIVIALCTLLFLRPNAGEQRSTSNTSGYRAAGDQFMSALSKNDASATFNLMTYNGQQDIGSKEKWTQLVTTAFAGDKSTPEFLSEYDVDDPAGIYKDQQPKLLTYRTRIQGATWEISLTIIKDKDSWKIDRLSSDVRQ